MRYLKECDTIFSPERKYLGSALLSGVPKEAGKHDNNDTMERHLPPTLGAPGPDPPSGGVGAGVPL